MQSMRGESTGRTPVSGIVASTVLTAMLFAACSADTASPPAGDDTPALEILATTSIWGDVVRGIVGPDASVEVLLPIGADPHDYQASASQAVAVRNVDLVVTNGLHLEDGLADVLDAAEADGANLLAVGEQLDPQPFSSPPDDHDDSTDALDPHVWLDPVRVAEAARIIGAELAKLDDTHDWTSKADDYADELLALDRELETVLSAVPSESRRLITNHDALGYFAQRYDFVVVGTVIPGGSTLANPSSQALADLVARIREEDVAAIFAETIEPSALAESVAAEVGEDIVVVELYTGSLGAAGSGAETLVDMLRVNAGRIADALS